MYMTITIKHNRYFGGYLISDSNGHYMTYLGYTKQEALRKFKERFGLKYKRGINIVNDICG